MSPVSPMSPSKEKGARPFTAAVGNRSKKKPLINVSPGPESPTNASSTKKHAKSGA